MPRIFPSHNASLAATLGIFCFMPLQPLICVAQDAPPADAESSQPGPARHYKNAADLGSALKALADEHPTLCTLSSIGKSFQGRDIHVLRVAGDGAVHPDSRPALLLTAGIDGDLPATSEVALAMAERLLDAAAADNEQVVELLTNHTVYVIPRINVDAAESYFGPVKWEQHLNLQPDDPDRDGFQDEDGPEDLNGDGLVTMMRVYDPERADSLANPNDARLNVKADPSQRLAPTFVLYTEGLDNDNDENFNEDGPGGTDPNRNFMHNWKQYDASSGLYPTSAPETLALLRFVLDHQNIAIAYTLGSQDNLFKPPSPDPKDAAGVPVHIDGGDVAIYKAVGEKYREITGVRDASNADHSGAFYAWAYAQFGIPSFTSSMWVRPEVKEEPKDSSKVEAQPSQTVPTAEVPAAESTVTDEGASPPKPAPAEVALQKQEPKKEDKNKDYGDVEELAWLKYSDVMCDGSGFVPWQKFDHPQLGEVEIGGWKPFFRSTPSANAIDPIVDGQYKFLLELGTYFPSVSLAPATVTRLGSNLFEVKTRIVNSGFLPAGTAMAQRNQRARPFLIRLSTPTENIVTGQRVNRIWSLPGSGGKQEFRWIISAPEGSVLTLTLFSEKYGTTQSAVDLK